MRRSRPTGDILLGYALRAARKDRCITAAELARRLGVGDARVRQWEGAHKAMPPPMLFKIERELGVVFHGVRRDGRSPHHYAPVCRVDMIGRAELAVTRRSTGTVVWSATGNAAPGLPLPDGREPRGARP